MQAKSIEWRDNKLYIIDQTRLPLEKKVVELSTLEETEEAIRRLMVRGAPAIGIVAAYGAYVAFRHVSGLSLEAFKREAGIILSRLNATRPTAVNLSWALKQIETIVEAHDDVDAILARTLEKAIEIHQDDEQRCRKMGENGQELIPRKANILTHCNTGALATGGIGTALSLIYVAHEQKKEIHVFMDETRPLLQGARLTAWELTEAQISSTLITDSMAAWLMRQGKIDLILVGADRIAANGDAANKIGTYSLAVNAKHHNIPFYVVAPLSTFDLSIGSGAEIVIEQRQKDEVRKIGNCQTAPERVDVYNPAFDVTPAELITAIVTERKIFWNKEFNTIKDLNL